MPQIDWYDGNRVEPFIEGIPTYRALETAIAAAEETVHMAYWRIDPSLETVNGSKPSRWGELLAATVERGVTVRLIMADFDPILGAQFHRRAWRSFRRFWTLRESLPEEARDRLQLFCSRHEARIGSAIRLIAQPILQTHLWQMVREFNKIAKQDGPEAFYQRLAIYPGLWPLLRITEGPPPRIAFPLSYPTVYPAAHHEKLCVIDDRIAFLGGLDIDEDRFDGLDHENERGWHDVACRVDGPAARFFAVHFRLRWNSELVDFQSFMERMEPLENVEPIGRQPSLVRLATELPDQAAVAGTARVAPVQTRSSQRKSSFSRSPKPEIMSCLKGYRHLIGSARRFIYVENQFLRSMRIVRAIIARARREPKLEILIILPVAPEMALTEKDVDTATRHGQYLQDAAIVKLRKALRQRVGIFSFKRAGKAVHRPEEQQERTLAEIIYVHAKVMIVDDEQAMIGSANLNDRSLFTDTEAGILWHEPAAVRSFREALWNHALGDNYACGLESPIVPQWIEHAAANAELEADSRQGFLMPLTRSERRAFRKRNWLVPEENV